MAISPSVAELTSCDVANLLCEYDPTFEEYRENIEIGVDPSAIMEIINNPDLTQIWEDMFDDEMLVQKLKMVEWADLRGINPSAHSCLLDRTLFVKDTAGKIHELDCNLGEPASFITLSSSVHQLKQAVTKFDLIQDSGLYGGTSSFTMYFCQRCLDESRTLESYGIEWGTTLNTSVRVIGGEAVIALGTYGSQTGEQHPSSWSRCPCAKDRSYRCGVMHEKEADVQIIGQEYQGRDTTPLLRMIDLTHQKWGIEATDRPLLNGTNQIEGSQTVGLVSLWASFRQAGEISFRIRSKCFNNGCSKELKPDDPVVMRWSADYTSRAQKIRFDENAGANGACCDDPQVIVRSCVIEWKSADKSGSQQEDKISRCVIN